MIGTMLSKEELRISFPMTGSSENTASDSTQSGADTSGDDTGTQSGADTSGSTAGTADEAGTSGDAADTADGTDTSEDAASAGEAASSDDEEEDIDIVAETETETTTEAGMGGWISSHPVMFGVSIVVVLALIAAVVYALLRKKRTDSGEKAAKNGTSSTGGSGSRNEGNTAQGGENMSDTGISSYAGSQTGQPAEPLSAPGTEPAGNQLLVGKLHNIGSRSSQQDSFGLSRDGAVVSTDGVGLVAVVADGMGGLKDGDQVSMRVGIAMLQSFEMQPDRLRGDQKLLAMLNYANNDVNKMQSRSGAQKSGSTVVSVLFQDNSMYWLSVGDSHIYLYRDGDLLQINRDHVYAVELDEKAARGEISVKSAMEDPQRKALTSYIGMGKIEKIDRNTRPLRLQTGDRILLMSDGVFGTLSEEEIAGAMKLSVDDACKAMDQMIQTKNRTGQDNYTALVLEFR
ncbi:MAG: protein phosphatase 2C domain-containing protein [Lachnospiraceae bacterium]|nr:protein phosphatase 2C domain-containing protein [Lachnospiraceae bacterium]